MNLIPLPSAAPAADDAVSPTKICPRCGSVAPLHAARCEACGRVYKTRWTPDPPPEAPPVASTIFVAPPEAPAAREDGGLSFLASAPSLSAAPHVPPAPAPRAAGPARTVGLSLLLLITLLLALCWLFPPALPLSQPTAAARHPNRGDAFSPSLPVSGGQTETRADAHRFSRSAAAVGARRRGGSASREQTQAADNRPAGSNLPTLIAAIKNKSWDEVQAALKRGEDINQADETKTTALMWAISYQWPEVVEELLKRGAEVNSRNDNDLSALDYATEQDDIARLLRKAGARDEEPEVGGPRLHSR